MPAPRKLAVFDIDGTLLQTTGVDDACFVGAFRDAFGIDRVDADWSQYDNCTDAVVVPAVLGRHLGREATEDDVARHRERFAELLREARERDAGAFAATRGAQAVLDALARRDDWAAAIATGGWRRTSLFKLRAGGLEIGGIPIATASDARLREEIVECAVRRAAEAARVEAFEKTVVIGDAVWDLLAAHRLGYGLVGIARGAGAERLRAAGAATVLAEFPPPPEFVGLLEAAQVP